MLKTDRAILLKVEGLLEPINNAYFVVEVAAILSR